MIDDVRSTTTPRHAHGTERPRIPRRDQTRTEPVTNTPACSAKNSQVVPDRLSIWPYVWLESDERVVTLIASGRNRKTSVESVVVVE